MNLLECLLADTDIQDGKYRHPAIKATRSTAIIHACSPASIPVNRLVTYPAVIFDSRSGRVALLPFAAANIADS